ncbi:PCC domain-containing protein [Lutispora thermophila]|uniref:PPC domain-containing protein n=1 Tax=Lutispora thermophila DSM 19022 TaxID=1122184 RepID=A0A1M6E7N1_9FIRM|nr:DUF296 domain-containing protein [Lutispora thermophila]SHI81482.1 hypothetical protein SAMN02745176_01472 [Lutispora thermophila DSM 19022]
MNVKKCSKDADIKRTLAGRIPKDMDLLMGIKEFCKSYGVKHGYIVGIEGSLKSTRFVYTIKDKKSNMGITYSEPVMLSGFLEILAGQGLVGLDDKDGLSVDILLIVVMMF